MGFLWTWFILCGKIGNRTEKVRKGETENSDYLFGERCGKMKKACMRKEAESHDTKITD